MTSATPPRALTDDTVETGAYPLVGPAPTLTGPESAATWARVLGNDIAYDGDIDHWYALVADRMAAREREDFKGTYKLFHRMRVGAKPAAIERCTTLLGRAPHSYEDYVRSVADVRP